MSLDDIIEKLNSEEVRIGRQIVVGLVGLAYEAVKLLKDDDFDAEALAELLEKQNPLIQSERELLIASIERRKAEDQALKDTNTT